MIPFYQPTDTELLICDLYQTIDINHPHEIDIEQIAALWGADIVYYEGKPDAYWDEDGSVIFLHKDDPIRKQRSDFFHELSHIVKHEGDQDELPGLFVDLQETQAWHFALIASMPYYLLPSPIEMTWSEYIGLLANEFNLPIEMATDRAKQIMARLHEDYHYYRDDINLMKSKIKMEATFHRLNTHKTSTETQRLLTQLHKQLSVRC